MPIDSPAGEWSFYFFIFYIYFLHTSQFCITEQGTNGPHTTLSKSDTDGSMKKNGRKKALDRKSDLPACRDVSEMQPETSASEVTCRIMALKGVVLSPHSPHNGSTVGDLEGLLEHFPQSCFLFVGFLFKRGKRKLKTQKRGVSDDQSGFVSICRDSSTPNKSFFSFMDNGVWG